jgi:hypothetical protein
MLRRKLIAGAVVGAASLAASPNVLAQAVVVEHPPAVNIVPASPPTPYYYKHYYRHYEDVPTPRVYRYYRYEPDDDGDLVVVLPRARGGCAPNHYWDGRRCVYSRW